MKRSNLIGCIFTHLTVLKFDHRDQNRRLYWLCCCKCGTYRAVRGSHLLSGSSKSCGCLCKHGHNRTAKRSPTYNSWAHMIQRCTNEKSANYRYYGGRGISICDSWFDFRRFLKDMGERPTHTSIDRINTDGNYEPSNCQWSTQSEQLFNRRKGVSA
jgi:hypothetical protein